MATTYLPINNGGLELLGINGEVITTPPARSINLQNAISVKQGALKINGNTVKTIQITVQSNKPNPDFYDFALQSEVEATATAGATVGSVTASDQWRITVNGATYTVTTTGGQTAAQIKTAMDNLLTANTQGFTFVSSNNAGVLLYNFTAPANTGTLWNGLAVNSTFPTNTGPTFSAAVHTNFAGAQNSAAVGKAGATIGSITNGDRWVINVNGTPFTYTGVAGNTPAQVETAMSALLAANTQGFTFSASLIGSTILYNIIAPADSTSSWNGYVITSTFPTNTGPSFSAAVQANFASGIGVAEQLQAFLTAQSITSPLVSFTGVLTDGSTTKLNGPSLMLNNLFSLDKSYDGTNTLIQYSAPQTLNTSFLVAGNQAA